MQEIRQDLSRQFRGTKCDGFVCFQKKGKLLCMISTVQKYGGNMKINVNKPEELIIDIVEWDIRNWWRAIEYWEETHQFDDVKGKRVLDIGGRGGGLSLYWALKGAAVICSDVNENGFVKAKILHKKYGVEGQIKYQVIDATEIPYQEEFDIICFKSVLGGVGYDNNYCRQKKMMESIYLALKEKGKLCFCENMVASPLHQFARKRFTGWGSRWRYVNCTEIRELTKEFSETQFQTFGFLGVFGRKKWLSEIFGNLDGRFDKYVRDKSKYIVSCVCSK